MRIRDLAALGLVAPLLGSCASTTAPPGWLPSPREAQQDPYGGWVTMDAWVGDQRSRIDGELIAVTPDTLYVLEGRRLIAFDRYRIVEATLNRYAPASGPMSLWTTVGSLSSLTHGYLFVLSMPTWILTGVVSTNSVTRDALMRYPGASLQSFAPYARFPVGPPPPGARLEPRPFLHR